MSKRPHTPDDYDSPWKDTLQRFLRESLEFFFPPIAGDVDWSRGYESLDKEFQQIVRRAKLGKAIADKLFKVYLRDGSEHWLLIHVEVQGNVDPTFPLRMFRYNAAAFFLYNREVVRLALLTDEDRNWRPHSFAYGRWGSRTGTEFLTAKLLDYLDDTQALENSTNPTAAVVLAHGQALITRGDPPRRRDLKFQLVKGLYQRGWAPDDIRELLRIIDWMMDLPDALEEEFRADVHAYEQEHVMRYVTSFERLARREGYQEGQMEVLWETIALLLEDKFGAGGHRLLRRVRSVHDVAALQTLLRAVSTAKTLAEVRDRLPKPPKVNGESR